MSDELDEMEEMFKRQRAAFSDDMDEVSDMLEESRIENEQNLKRNELENKQLEKFVSNSNRDLEHPFIDAYENEYKSSLKALDAGLAELIKTGHEMRAMFSLGENIVKINEIYESLHVFYSYVYFHQDVLSKHNSTRFKKIGHKLLETKAIFEKHHSTENHRYIESNLIDKFQVLRNAGFYTDNEHVHPLIILEIAYMIEVLRVVMEPDFIPADIHDDENDSVRKVNRQIHASVKQYVWRRDRGKCIECESQEKLEYDHIIPVAKGGSNTERNIQLLCEKCNRHKSAKIQ